MYWHKHKETVAGGLWRCRIRKREVQSSAVAHRKRPARDSRYWHKPDGGYVTRRRRHLAAERARILDQLATLREEEQAC